MVHKQKRFILGEVLEWIEIKSGEKYSSLSYDEKVSWINQYMKEHDIKGSAK
jgi:hypothetical protein